MKIGVDARNLVPNLSGIGRYVFEMCKTLSARGHSLFLYLPEKPGHDLPNIPNSTIRIWNYRGPIRRAWWSRYKLPLAANEDKLDLFWGPAHRLPTGLSKDLPKILTIHDLVWKHASDTMKWQTWLGEVAFMGRSLRQADHIIAVSESTRCDIIHSYPKLKDKITVVYPGLSKLTDETTIEIQASQVWQIDRPYALFVGTLEPRKNLKRLLKAYRGLPDYVRNQLLLVIVGGQGWRLDNLTNIISSYGLDQSVRLTGYVSNDQLAALYASCEFLVMPSLYEGFGFPIIEAQSYGKAVITSNISSMPEVAQVGSLLVNPLDVGGLTTSMFQLTTDLKLRAAIEADARLNANRFSWNKAGQEFEEVLMNVRSEYEGSLCSK